MRCAKGAVQQDIPLLDQALQQGLRVLVCAKLSGGTRCRGRGRSCLEIRLLISSSEYKKPPSGGFLHHGGPYFRAFFNFLILPSCLAILA